MYYKKRRKGFVSIGDDNRRREREEIYGVREKRMKRIVWIDKEDYIAGCWLMEVKYAKFHGGAIHQVYAAGDGDVARHLCSDSYCVNPMHLLRGTNYDNANDEVFMRDVFAMYGKGFGYSSKDDMLPVLKKYLKESILRYLNEKPLDRIIRDQLIYADILMKAFKRSNDIIILEV